MKLPYDNDKLINKKPRGPERTVFPVLSEGSVSKSVWNSVSQLRSKRMRERLAYCGLTLLYSFFQADLWEGVREMGGCGAEEAEKRGECRARYFFLYFKS